MRPTPLRIHPRRVLDALLVPFILVPVLGITVAQPWRVVGESMTPSIADGSVLLVDAIGPAVGGYRRGDIVVVPLPDSVDYSHRMLVKRIVALPGEHVHIANGELRIDDHRMAEPYIPAGTVIPMKAGDVIDVVVPPGDVFVMGDHRENSYDSKAFGPVPIASLRGRAWIALGPNDVRVELPVHAAPIPGS